MCVGARHLTHATPQEEINEEHQPEDSSIIEHNCIGQQTEASHLLSYLLNAFGIAPQDVLMSCAKLIEDGDADVCHGAEYLMSHGLLEGLQEPKPAAHESAAVLLPKDILEALRSATQLITDIVERGELLCLCCLLE